MDVLTSFLSTMFVVTALGWASLQQWMVQHMDTIMPMTVGILSGLFAIYAYDWTASRWRKKRMSAFQRKMREGRRKAYLDSVLADIICDGLENAEHIHKISRSEKRYLYWRARTVLKIWDLTPGMPMKVWFKLLKKAIKSRLGDKKPITLPAEDGKNWVGTYPVPQTLDDILNQRAA